MVLDSHCDTSVAVSTIFRILHNTHACCLASNICLCVLHMEL